MENNDPQIVIVTTPKQTNGVETSMQRKLSSLRSTKSKCCIYKVPEFIRKENKECYQPSVISIGPVFSKDPSLQTMQQLKWIYLESFLQHPNNSCRKLESYIDIVRELNWDIRYCYQEPSMIPDDDEFIEMIVLDSVFLLYFFMTTDPNECSPLNSFLIPKELAVLKSFMDKDMFLLENQVPFFVLKRIFNLAFPTKHTSSLINMACKFISEQGIPGAELVATAHISDNASDDIAHLVDFCMKCCVSSSVTTQQTKGRKPAQLPEMTAKQLIASGVKFKKSETKNPLDITFNSKNGELHIPKLLLKDSTESVLRSILFYEQCTNSDDKDSQSHFIELFFFFDKLIDTVEDIQLLQESGILNNLLGSDEAAVKLFNNITTYLSHSPNNYYYSSVSEEVNTYANKQWNRWIAILRRDYFKHPWAIISFVFAILIFILTALKTIASLERNMGYLPTLGDESRSSF